MRLFLLLGLILAGGPASGWTLPAPQGRVSDFANILDLPARTTLLTLIHGVETQTSAELAVVTVPSLEGLTVEQYAHQLFSEWGIGKKGKDNGVLLLVAPVERKMRIEVGYGLEAVLPDGLCGDIIRRQMLPAFKQGALAEGTVEGGRRLAELILKGEPASSSPSPRVRDGLPALFTFLFLSIFVTTGFWIAGSGWGSKTFLPILWGGLFGGIPISTFAYPMLPVSHTAGLALWAGLMGWWGYRSGKKHPTTWRGRGKQSRGSGWVAGGGSGGSSGSGFSGGGSFGGGSSGGGGASGSW